MKRTFTIDEMINEIAEVLREGDGEFVLSIAQQVLVPEISYDGDSIYTQEFNECEDEVF
jgi:hypothetical protein